MNQKRTRSFVISKGRKGGLVTATGLLFATVSMLQAADWPTESLGLGAVSLEPVGTQRFAWEDGVSRASRTPPTPYLAPDFSEPVPSNDWASSLVVDQFSKALHAHPVSFKAGANGFEIAMAPEVIGPVDYMGETSVRRNHNGNVDLVVNGQLLNANDARLAGTDDWSYDILMSDASHEMQVTIGHGLPFSYYHFNNTDAQVSIVRDSSEQGVVFSDETSAMVRILDPVDNQFNYYGVFFPQTATLEQNDQQLSIDFVNDQGYLSVAGLPDDEPQTWQKFKSVAFNFVSDTRVNWYYDELTGEVITQYQVSTDNKPESRQEGTVLSLFPHQWRYATTDYDVTSYDSIRGEMKSVVASEFTTVMPYTGILPQLPLPQTDATLGKLKQHLADYYGYGYSLEPQFIQPGVDAANTGYDTYWMGKNLNRLSGLVSVSDALDDQDSEVAEMTDTMFSALKGQLEYWFDGNKPIKDNYFYYNDDWGTLIGYPSSYDTDTDLNDHHFHYGYWIHAAAQIAMREPEWASDENWGLMVKELIGDIATADRDSNRYPFLRNFDIYEGHSWASGTVPYVEDGYYPEGNNNEASSEGINAWAALILWGEATGDKEIRDLGIYLYTHEVEAANTYWFNLYGDVGHPEYPNIEISRVWSGGYDHTTWWTEDPIQTHGINMLPITGASFYLGKDPEFVQANYDAIWAEFELWDGDNGLFDKAQVKDRWQDLINEYLAFADPDAAIANWKDTNDFDDPINGVDPALGIEFGESRAHTYQHLQMLKQLGRPDLSIRPIGHTLGAAFVKDDVITYAAYNPGNDVKTLGFSNGMGFVDVPPRTFVQGQGESVPIGPPIDSDDDGVRDALDQCPETPVGEAVNDIGCEDSDRDGIHDNLDLCPATEAGDMVNSAGCPDSDGDDVYDNLDACPQTPDNTPVTATGCADNDQDGIADTLDLCPATPLGQTVDQDGCAVYDDDSDGVFNDDDQCPNTPEGQLVNSIGCTDNDQDGVSDSADQCLNSEPGDQVNAEGCGDEDNDGVADNVDECSGTAAGTEVTASGCPVLPYGLISHDDGQAVIYLNSADWADAHFQVNHGGQQNVRMTQTGTRNEHSLMGLDDGDVITVYFTYLDAGCACVKDTDAISFTYQGSPIVDDDNDGVANDADQCPQTPPGATVDAQGCTVSLPVDSDNDGVADENDLCPNTPTGVAVDAYGCEQIGNSWNVSALSGDQVTVTFSSTAWADLHFLVNNGAQQNVRMTKSETGNEYVIRGLNNGDTLRFWFTYYDAQCACVKDSVTVEQIVTGQSPLDSDGDGVTDAEDLCPDTLQGVDVDAQGCPVSVQDDLDNDGVSDDQDQCPNTAPEATVDEFGCAVDKPYGAVVQLDGSLLLYTQTGSWADVHYSVNGSAQQNVRMINSGTGNEWVLSAVSPGDQVLFSFTYWDTDCNCAQTSLTMTIALP